MNNDVLTNVLNTVTWLANLFQYIISLFLVVMVAACFLGRDVELKRKQLLLSLGIPVLSVTAGVIMNTTGVVLDNDQLFLLNQVLTLLLYAYAFFFYLLTYKKKRIIRAIESAICYYILTKYLASFSQMTVVFLLGGTDEVTKDIYYDNFGNGPLWTAISLLDFLITLALFLITYFGFFKQKKYYIIGKPARILFVIWAMVFGTFAFIPALIPNDVMPLEYRYHIMSIMFGLGIVILGLGAPVFVVITSAERSHREMNKLQESYLAAELEYIEQYKKKQMETRAFRHDINNNLQIVQMLLKEGQTGRAEEHIKDMIGNVSGLSQKYVTGDEMLDMIISMKSDKMDKLGISFSLDGIADGGLNMKPTDMCSIFANILDNAIEAASSSEDKTISFGIKKTERFFVIRITNSVSSKVDTEMLLDSLGYTTKNDKDRHGFGLMNVKRTVEEYSGLLKAESDDRSFSLTVMLPKT